MSVEDEEYTDTTAPDVIPFLPAGMESDLLGILTGSFLSIPTNGGEPLSQVGAYIPGIEPSPPRRLRPWDGALPEIPANNRNVTGIVNNEFVRPHIPPHRFSADARGGISSQGGSNRQLYLYS
ncbi:MAG: hypothetical protein HRU08_11910, partial [Oleispira sp.]|nr:hypothetical protein [Oleispira sp.]